MFSDGLPVWAPPVNVNLEDKATDYVCLRVGGREMSLATYTVLYYLGIINWFFFFLNREKE